MSGQVWIWLIVGGVLAYVLIKSGGASYSANPLQNVLQNAVQPGGAR